MVLQHDDDAAGPFGGILFLVAIALFVAGLVFISAGSWSLGLGCIGVACIVGGFGGPGSIESVWGKITLPAGMILLIAAFVISQFFHV